MRKIKRLAAFFLVFVALLSLNVIWASAADFADVAAGESVITSIEDIVPYTYWYYKGYNINIHHGFVTSDDYSLGNPRHGSDGNTLWIYCLAFQVQALSPNARHAALPAQTANANWNALSNEQRLGITLATLYGFPMSNNGGNDDDGFTATQCIIWEFQTGIRTSTKENKRQAVSYTFNDNGSVNTVSLGENFFYNIMASKASGATAYNTLISKIYNHFKQPSFANEKIELSYDSASGKYVKTLTDTNGVLSSFDVTCDSGVGVSVSGNTLTLTASKYVNGANLTLTKKALPTTSQTLMILDPDNGQAMLTGQVNVPVSYSYKVYALNGAIQVQKRSSDNIVAGMKFRIVGNGIDKELVTDAAGVALLNNIPVGTYTVTEVMEDRYVTVPPKTVTVVGGQTSVALFSNVVKSGDLKVKKVDSKTGLGVPGAQFEVYDTDDKHIATEMTDDEGVATFKGLLYGSYYVMESLAPPGYLLSDETFSFDIWDDGQVISWNCPDENLMRKFSVYKKGEVLTGFVADGSCYKPVYEEQYLDGAKVGIYAAEDIYTLDGTKRFEKDELVETLITSSLGPIETGDLFEGIYYAKELSAPEGYVLGSDAPVLVYLFEDNLSAGFYNERQKCSLNFEKRFDDGSKDFSAVTFGLYNASPILDLPAGSLLEIIRPSADGMCTMTCDLPCGYDYYIKELSTAPGFAMPNIQYPFSFTPTSDSNVTLDPITNVKIEVLSKEETVEPDEERIAQTDDVNADEARFYAITALETLGLIVVLIVRKKKLTLYY